MSVSTASINLMNVFLQAHACYRPIQGRMGRIGKLLSVRDRIVAHFNVASHNLLQGMWKT
jgi:hypothetical protein